MRGESCPRPLPDSGRGREGLFYVEFCAKIGRKNSTCGANQRFLLALAAGQINEQGVPLRTWGLRCEGEILTAGGRDQRSRLQKVQSNDRNPFAWFTQVFDRRVILICYVGLF